MRVSPLSQFHNLLPGHFLSFDEFNITWQSPSNIAIVKYWGKKEGQIPMNPSLSMTLKMAVTQTTVHVTPDNSVKGLISVNGDPTHPFLQKMRSMLLHIAAEIPFVSELTFTADTHNHFPHSTGIASSASGLSAFSLCILEIAVRIIQATNPDTDITRAGLDLTVLKNPDHAKQDFTMADLKHMSSYAARFGSGSACRSLYGGFTAWGISDSLSGSSDTWAVPIAEHIHPDMLLLHDAILVLSGKPKELTSTQGHIAMTDHPFLSGRIKQANVNFVETLDALSSNDFEKLGLIAENEALTLHALLMSANSGTLLMQPFTVEIIHRIRRARRRGLPVFFTLDAGANVHVLYPNDAGTGVERFIAEELQPLCEDGLVIYDCCGDGPVKLTQKLNN